MLMSYIVILACPPEAGLSRILLLKSTLWKLSNRKKDSEQVGMTDRFHAFVIISSIGKSG